ncbi:MAG: 5-(carboxyamino)imidazole ribonucleotide synthase [Phycisphaera sp.]|nr:5-(carboxyamino)imidazole ribonucleotide synthase [Phycisphaera sp.]
MAPILPGQTLGVLGGGQLGRMFTIAARRLGYRVHVLVPGNDTPTGQVADLEINADYEDLDAVARFAKGVSVVTFEFENVSAAATDTAAKYAPVRPAGSVLHTTQHRLREKTFLRDAGLPVTPFAPVRSLEELNRTLVQRGAASPTPIGVLKTASWGYDGKGQSVIRKPTDAGDAWASLKTDEAILEDFIDFECELSVVAVRGMDGSFTSLGPMLNTHVHHILDTSVTPTMLGDKIERQAIDIARATVEKLNVVGVLCVEFFLTRSGKLLINELAPRPHNSGHLTIDAHVSCQFEQQVRSICGLPLGSTRLHAPAAMANLLGDLWQHGEPNWHALLDHRDVKLHLYGKNDPRKGRKMGHLTVLGTTPEEARAKALAAREALTLKS